MLVHPYVERMAQTLVRYSLALEKGQTLLIQGSELTAPLIREVYRDALRVGAHPSVIGAVDGLSEIYFEEANDEQIAYISPLQKVVYESFDAILSILGSSNTRALSGADPKKQAARAKATTPLSSIFAERAGSGELKWCATQFPTQAAAQDANMSLASYERFLYKACQVDVDDPVAKWTAFRENQDRIIRAIEGIDALRIVGEETDLTLRVGGRTWINASGEKNFPDGEIFTGPIEDSAEGHIRFSFPGIYAGKAIEDIRLTFKGGKVVQASAKVGEDILKALLETDEGACRLGEIGIGTNFGIDHFSRNMLFDEKIGGTVHLAVGRGYPETGSVNKSGIHWDMLCDLRQGGEIYGDGKLIYKEGRFLI